MLRLRAHLFALVLASAIAATLALAIVDAVPRALPAPEGETVPCLSYAPFRRPGATPLGAATPVSPAQIAADLAVLRTRSRCVRTYGVSLGQDAVPAAARALGMKVQLGVWIGRDTAQNAAELATGARLARENRDVVETLVVGNEVLLRGDADVKSLAAMLDQARREAGVPVAYADVWEFWQRHAPALLAHVDVAAVHVLPYWEDEPVPVEQAVAHVLRTVARMRERLGPTPVWLAETGWPSAGRQREGARPGRVAQARFVRELSAAAGGLEYNLVEGFDQPWKRALEGAMGGAWGIFGADARPKFRWQGPVREAPWRLPATGAGLLAGLLAGFLIGRRARRGTTGRVVVFEGAEADGPASASGASGRVAATALVGALVPEQAAWIATWCRTPIEQGIALSVALSCALLAWLATDGARTRVRAPATRAEACVAVLVLGSALAHVGALLWSPRYLGFATPLFAAPAAVLFAHLFAVSAGGNARRGAVRAAAAARAGRSGLGHAGRLAWRAAALALAAGALLVAIREGPANAEAIWAALISALGVGLAAHDVHRASVAGRRR